MLSMDLDGQYCGLDYQVYIVKGFDFYFIWLLWDVYCVQQLLMVLLYLDKSIDFICLLFVVCVVSLFGILLVWVFGGLEIWCMIGYYVVLVIVDVYFKGVCGFDVNEVLQVMVVSVSYGLYGDLVDYMKFGYVLIDCEFEGVFKMFEYVYDDWIIVQMVKVMGKCDIVVIFGKCVGNWCNVWDVKIGFMCVWLVNGLFCELFDLVVVGYGSDYIEGNVFQYFWYVLQDVFGLIVVMGGKVYFIDKFDGVFDVKVDLVYFKYVEDIIGLIGWYVYGNELSYYLVYLYDYVGVLWKIQQCLKQIMDSQYVVWLDGLVGNDDLGQMLVWYVFMVLGFYLVMLGSDEYVIGCLFVVKVVLYLVNDKIFMIIVVFFDVLYFYVGEIILNGQFFKQFFLYYCDLVVGGELYFCMIVVFVGVVMQVLQG